jgi:hypothetical protein
MAGSPRAFFPVPQSCAVAVDTGFADQVVDQLLVVIPLCLMLLMLL